MNRALRIRYSHLAFRVPAFVWHRVIEREARGVARALASLGDEERRIRELAVLALGDATEPLEPARMAAELALAPEVVERALDRLEKKLVFLARNERGAVTWAYPVTADETPHYLAFESGERTNAA